MNESQEIMTKKMRVLYEMTPNGPEPVSVYCSSTAVGADTLATSDISVEMTSHGRVTITKGTATSTASASSPSGDTAYASATTEVVTASDILQTNTTTASGSGTTGDSSWWTQTSSTRFFSIDIDGVELGRGPISIERNSSALIVSQPEIDANVATLDVDATVYAADSYVEVQAAVLTIEDQLSSSDAMVLIA
jgi:hypothetical protein